MRINMKNRLVIFVLVLVFLGLGYFKVTRATQDVEPRPYCHATESEEHPYNYLFNTAWVQHLEDNGTPLSGHEKDFFAEGDEDCDGEVDPTPTVTPSPEVTPTVEPSVTPTPTPECDEDECVTPTPTETPEVTPTPRSNGGPVGAPQGPACESVKAIPTLTYNGTEFVWTEVGTDSFWFRYGPTQDNLPYSVVVEDNHFMPKVEWQGHVWASVSGYNGCVGSSSTVVDP